MSAEPKPHLRLEIAHVLFIDIVGYSKLLIDEQKELLQELNELVRKTDQVREAEAEGKLVRLPTGDGMALVFSNNPEAPVECALEISKALQSRPEIKLRMGIHSGAVNQIADVNDRSNVAGAGINIAQRVMDCGDAGHILLSKHVAEDLAQYRHWQPHLHGLGEVEVKHGNRIDVVNLYTDELGNPRVPEKFSRVLPVGAAVTAAPPPSISKPAIPKWVLIVAVVLILGALAIGLVVFQSKRSPMTASTSSAIPEKSIAVLPFENRSEEKANAYFADGIQDEILTLLSKIADLKVISRTSTQHYKSAPENLPEIARQLGVAHIVEGSVQKSGDSVRVNVQLIRAKDDSHLWADSFDRKLTDLFSVETEVAKAIAEQLRVHITGREQQAIATKPTDVPEAYYAYLQGLAFYRKPGNTPANVVAAQKHLREAVRLDPKFALAWALLGTVEAGGYNTTVLQRTPALLEEARQAVETALNLQPDLGEAIFAQGFFYYGCLRDYEGAIRYFEQARQLLPNDSRIPEALAYIARRRGDWNSSLAYFEEAEQLNPRDVRLLNQHAFSFIAMRRFREALTKVDQFLEIAPDDIDGQLIKAPIAQAEGDLPAAAAILSRQQIPITNPIGLEIRLRQSLLERNYAAGIQPLQEIISHSDPAIGWYLGELRFYLGWAQHLAGDSARAEQTLRQARGELEEFLKQQPQNAFVIGDLALVNMALGDKTAAFRFAEEGIAANPAEKDHVAGPAQIEILARVAAHTGENDRAIEALSKLLVTPYQAPGPPVPLTPALLRLDPMFDPIRNDPRFQKLCEDKPK